MASTYVMFHGCWLIWCAKLVRFICDLHVAASHLTFAYDPQRNNQITSIKHVVFPSGLTMLGLVSFPDLTLIFWVAMIHLLFVYSCHEVVFKIFVTLFTRTGIWIPKFPHRWGRNRLWTSYISEFDPLCVRCILFWAFANIWWVEGFSGDWRCQSLWAIKLISNF